MRFLKLVVMLVLLIPVFTLADDIKEDQAVFEYVVKKANGTVFEITDAVKTALNSSGTDVLAVYESKAPGDCKFRAHVIIGCDSSFAAQVFTINPQTAPFAVFDRINVFEDEDGVHVSIVNPVNILRTVLMDDDAHLALADSRRAALRWVIEESVRGTVSNAQYGETRDEGYIGRTMGVMAGGLFSEKIGVLHSVAKSNVAEVAAKLAQGLQTPGAEWQLHAVFNVDFPQAQTAVIGFSGAAMEARSFDIVKAGSDDSRSDFMCPGIAHAAAYPIELALVQSGNNVNILLVDAMYRMKMYFEDAGIFAFAQNMGMPGSIHDEIEALVQKALK
jgi:uncharacterized protein (DUF302 family)